MRLLKLLILFTLAGPLNAQLTNSGATIVVESGGTLSLQGSRVTTVNDAAISNSGTIIVEGNLENNGAINGLNLVSELIFTGTTPSTFTANDASMTTVTNRKRGAPLILVGDLEVRNLLDLDLATNSVLRISDGTLTLQADAVVNGAGPQVYLETAPLGILRREISASGPLDFPVGNTTGQTALTMNVSGTNLSSFSNSSVSVRVNPQSAPDLPAGTTDFVNRHWEIFTDNITDYRGAINATYLPADVVGQESAIIGATWAGSDWTALAAGRTGQTLSATTTDPDVIFTGFAASFLPVELLDFTARAVNKNTVRLDWATATEQGSAGFAVERSATGNDWAPIGWVAAAGDSELRVDYTFTDADLPTSLLTRGEAFYRLRMVDLDGSEEFSPVRRVGFDGHLATLSAYPNPTTGELRLGTNAVIDEIRVYDGLGRRVLRSTTGQIDLSELPAGTYRLRALTGNAWQTATVTKR